MVGDLAPLLARLVDVRARLVERMGADVLREPDRLIPDGLPLLADVQAALAAVEAVKQASAVVEF